MSLIRLGSVDLPIKQSWYADIDNVNGVIYVPYGVQDAPTVIKRVRISDRTLLSDVGASANPTHWPNDITILGDNIWIGLGKDGITPDSDKGLIERYSITSQLSTGTSQYFSLIGAAPRCQAVATVTDGTDIYAAECASVSTNPTMRRGGRIARINGSTFSQLQEIGLTETAGNGWNSLIGFGVWASGNAYFAALEQNLTTGAFTGNRAILKISTPSLSHVATYTTTTVFNDISTDGSYLYVAFDGAPGYVEKFDLSFTSQATYTLPGSSSPNALLMDTSTSDLIIGTADIPPVVYVVLRSNLTLTDPLTLQSADAQLLAGISNNNNKWFFISTDFNSIINSRAIELGVGGDPHFIGFDGVKFDYHGDPGNNYLIWLDNDTRIEATFDSPGELCPAWAHNTFMTKVKINDQVITVDELLEHSEEEIKTKTGLVRGLPEQINFIAGQTVGIKIVDIPLGKMIITSMKIDQFTHINLTMQLGCKYKGRSASGILGQTLLPVDKRLPNDTFKV